MVQNKHFFVGKTINCNGKLLDLGQSHIMGILNTTPDSFHDGGKYTVVAAALQHAEEMILAGASIIDVGGYSTRPGATDVSEQEEIDRVVPFIEALSQAFPHIILSIDTFRANVAEESIRSGAGIINDISGFQFEPTILEVVKKYQVPYVLMHLKGTPKNMQENPHYDDVVNEVKIYFEKKIKVLEAHNVHQIILDLGFGFGKNLEHNYLLFNKINYFIETFNLPQLVGISHKRMIRELLGTEKNLSLTGTTVLNTLALQQGASILRVHDAKEAVAVKKMLDKITNS